ncbi:hypothetical protein LYSHEL_29730 [Lysobacter helvus]|uniref:DUF2269 family protein n=2 Tax=Lysobacteraceae TaxID=32033 RepID=A0ABN6FWT2_9GAMM|nr:MULTISPECIES: hypothetical protein [Lysobacter]BCT93946.1 hypothetical protein LYSCAS_29700 [Lysobacter caseinilyticus]BCT97102.1 hypothetical protein LYSHEL_29730 [Lysobacter helvus]
MQQAVVRSQFVTAVAWVFIVLSGFGTLIAIGQNVMMQVMFATPEIQGAMSQADTAPGAPPYAGLLLGGTRYIFLFVLLMAVGTLAASIGLLRRNNIARVAFIVFLALGIAWQVLGLGLQVLMYSHMPFQDMSAEGGPDMRSMFRVISAFTAVLALAVAVVFGWLIKRLRSPAVRAEFH